jgi:hypothetical protein
LFSCRVSSSWITLLFFISYVLVVLLKMISLWVILIYCLMLLMRGKNWGLGSELV